MPRRDDVVARDTDDLLPNQPCCFDATFFEGAAAFLATAAAASSGAAAAPNRPNQSATTPMRNNCKFTSTSPTARNAQCKLQIKHAQDHELNAITSWRCEEASA